MPLDHTLPAFGQTGIRLRSLLAEGEGEAASALVPTLDMAHRIELLLGAALRDCRSQFRGASLFLGGERGESSWLPLCLWLATPGDDRLDALAAAYVAEGRAPEKWRAAGKKLLASPREFPFPDLSVAQQLQAGVSGDLLLDTFSDVSLYPAVSFYYRRGSIHALGPRPLLSLAAFSAEPG